MSNPWDMSNYKENDNEFLEGVHDQLKVKIISIKHHPDNKNDAGKKSPYTNICFKVIGGEQKDRLFNERFYHAAKFKMSWLIIACGLYEEVEGKKVAQASFNDAAMLVKRELYISVKKSEYNSKYTQIDQMSSEPLVVEENAKAETVNY